MGNFVRQHYHRDRNGWRSPQHRPVGQLAGIELEIEHPDGYGRTLEALPDPARGRPAPHTEMDSSINQRRGVEIIFPPYSYKSIKHDNSYITKAFKALGDADCGPGRLCGMHININTSEWQESTRNLFCAVIHGLPSALLTKIGGRRLNGYCERLAFASIQGIADRCTGSHMYATSLRANRIELRFPRATTDIRRVRTIVDFAEYVEAFVRSLQRDPEFRINHFSVLTSLLREVGRGSVEEEFRKFLDQHKRKKAVKNLLKVMNDGYDG